MALIMRILPVNDVIRGYMALLELHTHSVTDEMRVSHPGAAKKCVLHGLLFPAGT